MKKTIRRTPEIICTSLKADLEVKWILQKLHNNKHVRKQQHKRDNLVFVDTRRDKNCEIGSDEGNTTSDINTREFV